MKNFLKPLAVAGSIALAACDNSGQAPKKPEQQLKAPEAITQPAPSQKSMLSGIQSVVKGLEAKTFAALVPDSVVRSSIQEILENRYLQNSFGGNTVARHEVFENELCEPFGDKCWDALYAAYSGGEWYFQNNGIPVEADEPLNKARKLIMDKARNYLKDPQNLLTFYQSKKTIIDEELRKFADTPEKIKQLEKWLKGAEEGIQAFDDPKFQKAYAEYLAKEKEWSDNYPNDDDPEMKRFTAYQDAEKKLGELTPDLYASLFAGRRTQENSEVVKTWEEIAGDVRKSVADLQQ